MTPRPKVLVVDDEPSIRFVLERALGPAGFEVECAGSIEAARRRLDEVSPDVVFLDVRLPDGSGLDLLAELRKRSPAPHVVVMTARESMEVAVAAMKAGARDFVVKPFDLDRLLAVATDLSGRPRPEAAPQPAAGGVRPGRLIGASPAMLEVFKAIGRVAPTEVTVLVVGESGTGKELVARAIHDNSPRAGGPFITVNCAAIPADLMESELFGHERGSFTGAVDRRKGKFELAHGGTLFLDEVGEMPMALQSKLLRALQERVVERVGGGAPVPVDVRIIAATHRDLARMVEEGAFREDLYYRLNVVPLVIPPLRERPGDMKRLAEAFVARWGPELTGHPVRLAGDAAALLEAQPFPGNVRELENVVKRGLLSVRGAELRADDLAGLVSPSAPVSPLAAGTPPAADPTQLPLEALVEARLRPFLERVGDRPPERLHDLVMHRVERTLLALVLEHCGGNQLEAARVLGMNRNTLRKRIHDLDVPMPERRRNRRRG